MPHGKSLIRFPAFNNYKHFWDKASTLIMTVQETFKFWCTLLLVESEKKWTNIWTFLKPNMWNTKPTLTTRGKWFGSGNAPQLPYILPRPTIWETQNSTWTRSTSNGPACRTYHSHEGWLLVATKEEFNLLIPDVHSPVDQRNLMEETLSSESSMEQQRQNMGANLARQALQHFLHLPEDDSLTRDRSRSPRGNEDMPYMPAAPVHRGEAGLLPPNNDEVTLPPALWDSYVYGLFHLLQRLRKKGKDLAQWRHIYFWPYLTSHTTLCTHSPLGFPFLAPLILIFQSAPRWCRKGTLWILCGNVFFFLLFQADVCKTPALKV